MRGASREPMTWKRFWTGVRVARPRGLGQGGFGQALFDAVLATDKPLVLDADGLNLLSEKPHRRDNWVLTPHGREAGRLLSARFQEDRLSAVLELTSKFGGVALLKGAGTLISDGERVSLVPYGNPAMAVAGMGDVLSGSLAACWRRLASNCLLRNWARWFILWRQTSWRGPGVSWVCWRASLIPQMRRLLNQ